MLATLNGWVQTTALLNDSERSILSSEAVQFIARLVHEFEPRRRRLLEARRLRQQDLDRGSLPDFLLPTAYIRQSNWTVAPAPADLLDRRVELIGAAHRQALLNGLNSGARVFIADLEDSSSPVWRNVIEGQINLRDAVRGTIRYTSADGQLCELCECPAVLMVRPRGWHLNEKHVLMDGRPIPAALFDFGLFFFHNARALIENGTGPYFYLPKLESHLEARLWNDVFLMAQHELGISPGTIRATALIETIPAAFEMDEILWELRDHSAGLSCGHGDYIFSFIRKFHRRPDCVLPEREQIRADGQFLDSYASLLIRTCHRRAAHAIGGVTGQMPVPGDPAAHAAAMRRVRLDKLREVWAGHDGTRTAHAGLVPLITDVFDTHMPFPHQLEKIPEADIRAAELLSVPKGEISPDGLERNISVVLRYLVSWLRGNGCVAIHDRIADTATAEVCRAQVWQWLKHGVRLSDGRGVSLPLVRDTLQRQHEHLRAESSGRELEQAFSLCERLMTGDDFPESLAAAGYELLD